MGTSIFFLTVSAFLFGLFFERTWVQDRVRPSTTAGLVVSLLAVFTNAAVVSHYLGEL